VCDGTEESGGECSFWHLNQIVFVSVSAYTYMQRCDYFRYALQQEFLESVLFFSMT